jgi:hypothetical protein
MNSPAHERKLDPESAAKSLTATGLKGLQVTTIADGRAAIADDFCTLLEAEAFAYTLRRLDAGAPVSQVRGVADHC